MTVFTTLLLSAENAVADTVALSHTSLYSLAHWTAFLPCFSAKRVLSARGAADTGTQVTGTPEPRLLAQYTRHARSALGRADWLANP